MILFGPSGNQGQLPCCKEHQSSNTAGGNDAKGSNTNNKTAAGAAGVGAVAAGAAVDTKGGPVKGNTNEDEKEIDDIYSV